jgi:ABC-type sulfate/molybdate transport systems ATPase subunit
MMHGGNRGGVEQANIYEWGGESQNGDYDFDTERPNWEKPIHQLMADTNVTVFFHAHDHAWVKQELDGVVYQEVGSPADADYALGNWAKGYTDETSVVFENSGYTRVTVSPDQVQVDYVRTYLPEHENEEQQSGGVSYSYVIPAPSD